jgi:3-hydroxyacyl-[acyl-carrier-protein] dehydratase
MRFYLFDKITELTLGKSIEGVKCVTRSESFLEQHFPGRPVMPGTLIVEAMAQLSGYLLSKSRQAEGRYVFSILSLLEKVKFYEMVGPGEQIKIKAEIEKEKEDSAVVNATAAVNGEKVVSAQMLFYCFEIDGVDAEAKKTVLDRMFAGVEDNRKLFR